MRSEIVYQLNNDNDSERLVYNTPDQWDLEIIPHSGIFVSLYGATISKLKLSNTNSTPFNFISFPDVSSIFLIVSFPKLIVFVIIYNVMWVTY